MKNLTKSLVENSYLIFSIVSLTVGLFLILNFFKSIHEYIYYKNDSFFTFIKQWQTADYFMILFSILWIFVGAFLLYLFLKVKKFDKISDSKLVNYEAEKMINIFEFQFLKLLKQKSDVFEKMEYEYVENGKICKIIGDNFLIFFDKKLYEISNHEIDYSKAENSIFLNSKFQEVLHEKKLIDNERILQINLFEMFDKQLDEYVKIIQQICELLLEFEQKNEAEKMEKTDFFLKQILHFKNQFSETEKRFIFTLSKTNEKMNFFNLKYKLSV